MIGNAKHIAKAVMRRVNSPDRLEGSSIPHSDGRVGRCADEPAVPAFFHVQQCKHASCVPYEVSLNLESIRVPDADVPGR